MLTTLETYNDRKNYLWCWINLNKDLIKTITDIKGNEPIRSEVLSACRNDILSARKELRDLARWFKQSGLSPDEPYNRRVANAG